MSELHAWIERVRACIRNPKAHKEDCPLCSGTARLMIERRRVSAAPRNLEDESDA